MSRNTGLKITIFVLKWVFLTFLLEEKEVNFVAEIVILGNGGIL